MEVGSRAANLGLLPDDAWPVVEDVYRIAHGVNTRGSDLNAVEARPLGLADLPEFRRDVPRDEATVRRAPSASHSVRSRASRPDVTRPVPDAARLPTSEAPVDLDSRVR
jgi:hypothetical protein